MRKLKKCFFNILYLSDGFILDKFKSKKIAYACYKHHQYHRAYLRLPKGNVTSLDLNINYFNVRDDKFKLFEFFYNFSNHIVSKFRYIDPDFIIDFIEYKHNHGYDVSNYLIIEKCKKFHHVNWSIRILTSKIYDVNFSYNMKKNVKVFLYVARRLGVDIYSDNLNVYEPEINYVITEGSEEAFYDLFKKERELSSVIKEGLLAYYCKINLYDDVLMSYKKYMNELFIGLDCDFIESSYQEYLREKNRTKFLFFLNVNQFLKKSFLLSNFSMVVLVYKVCSIFGVRPMIIKSFTTTFLSLFSYYERFPYSFVSYINRKGLEYKGYNILASLSYGDIKEAENERRKIKTSLQYYLELLGNKVENINVNNDDILFVAEQGVADEVRWSRLYEFFDKPNVTISCDPRLYNLFSSSYPNIRFIPHKRLFRRDRRATYNFHKYNVHKLNSSVTLSTSMMFLLLPEDKLKTKFESYIKCAVNESVEGINIGIMWSSSLASGLRGHRYAIEFDEYLPLIKSLQYYGHNVYSIQSPLSIEDRGKCLQYGIKIREDIDLYNDFDSSAIFYKSLSAVIGPSSLNTELAASVGTTFYHLANQPEILSMRNGESGNPSYKDQLSNNTLTIYPKKGYKNRSKESINKDCINHVLEIILSERE